MDKSTRIMICFGILMGGFSKWKVRLTALFVVLVVFFVYVGVLNNSTPDEIDEVNLPFQELREHEFTSIVLGEEVPLDKVVLGLTIKNQEDIVSVIGDLIIGEIEVDTYAPPGGSIWFIGKEKGVVIFYRAHADEEKGVVFVKDKNKNVVASKKLYELGMKLIREIPESLIQIPKVSPPWESKGALKK